MRICTFLLLFALDSTLVQAATHKEKLKPEEVIARHLQSIGPADARSSINTRIISGTSYVVFRTEPMGQAYGRAVLASDGLKNLIGMSFNSPVYPREQFGFNGSSFSSAFVTPGVRSSLGSFLMNHDLVFKHGLMGGTLSTSWSLLDTAVRQPKLEYIGVKKIEHRSLHELRYMPRGGSDLSISIFFDEENFRHVRTEYRRVIAANLGNRTYGNVEERESRYKMIEEFANFSAEQQLTLPHTYTITLTVDAQGTTFSAEWQLKLTQFTFNQKIDPTSFSINTTE